MILLLLSILFNYKIGEILSRTKNKNVLLVGISIDLLLLGYYKYIKFFLISFNSLCETSMPVPEVVLPLGISFFTFTQIAFLVDAFRGETKGYSLKTYMLFVTFFPHLIAGPILYHKDIIPQLNKIGETRFSYENMAKGIIFFVVGLFKKVYIADSLSPWVKMAFDNVESLTIIDAWLGALAYTMQIYFDFSGYSEMAIGLGLMLNIYLPINFSSPYKARSIIDFWRRWHITLSEFLKNYLYIPIGGNRRGEFVKIRNLFLTMLLGGFWHGAGWNFIIWGALHGVYLVTNHIWRKTNMEIPGVVSWGITFIAVTIAWVFFRAADATVGMIYINAMFGGNGLYLPNEYAVKIGSGISFKPLQVDNLLVQLSVIAVLIWVVLKAPSVQTIVQKQQPRLRLATLMVITLIMCLLKMNTVSEFLYFQF
ncbi:MBOAT family O-acyltransferase [Azotosporobacter soli]|uniref:MBOAT family O-acyltransferase n=1 Tax=Azotosporobacter soli TaxID=3055040 RepID=UPI0031FE9CBD